jgi:hypothetical protein
VWSNDFVGVWHLSESASGTGDTDIYRDSSGNNFHGTDEVSATGKSGQIAKGQEFDADSADRIEVPHDLNDLFNGEATLSKWVRLKNQTPAKNNLSGFSRFERAGGNISHYPFTNGELFLATFNDSRIVNGFNDTSFNKEKLHRVTIRNTSTDWDFIRNAQQTINRNGLSSITLPTAATEDILIGSSVETRSLDGTIDEVRLSNDARSDSWLQTSFRNQNEPLAFLSVGPEQRLISGNPVVATAAGSTTADVRNQLSLLTATVNSQSTAIETKTRFFKFATTQATASTQAGTGQEDLTVDALTDSAVSFLTLLKLKELTQNRRSIDGSGSTDAVFQQPSDTVDYEQLLDGVEYDK